MSAPDDAALDDACAVLAQRDHALAKAHAAIGRPVWRSAPARYETLARLIAHQQISTQAAQAIWTRVCARFDPLTPETVLAASEDDLRECGLSRPKVAHLRAIAEAIEGDGLDLDAVVAMELDPARDRLVAVRGIGPWTAEVFLLYAAGALDAFPTADVGLMESHRLLSGLGARLDRKAFAALGETWRPYRGVAAHLLWGWIGAERAKSGDVSPQA